MGATDTYKPKMVSLTQDVEKSWDDELQQMVQTLREEDSWTGIKMYSYQGFWCPSLVLKPVISFQRHFQAFDSDIIVATFPKCGTTWLKALTFSTLYRNQFARDENPLLTFGPHQLVRFLEHDLYLNDPYPADLQNSSLYKPRLFATHVPYASLPTSIKQSNCKIIYICRNPMDMFISTWFFANKLRDETKQPLSLDEVFDKFCNGTYGYGCVFDHVLGYWKASQESRNKILLLQYEDLRV